MWPFRQRLLLYGRGGTNYIIQATTLFCCGRELDSCGGENPIILGKL